MANEFDSLDYKNFLSLTPEQQQKFGAAGLQFDAKGNIGDFSKSVGSLAGSNTNEGWGDKFSRWFTPNDKGFSTGGTFMDAFGKGAQGTAAIGGLAAEYLNYKADKKQAKWEKEKEENALKLTADRQTKVDQAGIDLSRNVGNGASYSYKPTVG